MRSSKLKGEAFRVIVLMLDFSRAIAFLSTTNWYFPRTPFLYIGTNPYPKTLKVLGRRIPLLSRLSGSRSLSRKNWNIPISYPTGCNLALYIKAEVVRIADVLCALVFPVLYPTH